MMYHQITTKQGAFSTPSGSLNKGFDKTKYKSCTNIVGMDDSDGQDIDARYHPVKKPAVRFSDDKVEESPVRSVPKEQIVGQIVRSKSVESLHILVLQDERRRQKVEALRDAILDQQIELWASTVEADYDMCLEEEKVAEVPIVSSTSINSMTSMGPIPDGALSKKLAFLSWRHSWDDVKVALESATTLQASLS